jgi:hypothetical protein
VKELRERIEAGEKKASRGAFSRAPLHAILSAHQIVATAQAFGQEDDITVLKVRRQPATESRPTEPKVSTLSPSIA